LRRTTSSAAGIGLGTTIKYLRGAAGIGLGTTVKYLRRTTSAAAGNGLGEAGTGQVSRFVFVWGPSLLAVFIILKRIAPP
jgi:hypothetical protein